GIIKGKVRYMSLEQASGKEVDRRADIFATGVLLFEAATQKRFWDEKNDLTILKALLQGEYPLSPKSLAADTPDEIDAICAKCLAHKKEDRYPNADALRFELESALKKLNILDQGRNELREFMNTAFVEKREKVKAIIEHQLRDAEHAERDQTFMFKIRPIRDRDESSFSMTGGEQSSPSRGQRRSGAAPNMDRATRSLPPAPSKLAARARQSGPPKSHTVRETGPEKLYTETRKSASMRPEDYSLITSSRPAARRSYTKEIAIVASAIVATVAVAKFAPQRDTPVQSVTSTATLDPLPARSPDRLKEDEPEVLFSIRTTTPGATLMLDGTPVSNPLETTFVHDGRTHTISAEAPGFKRYVETVSFRESLRLVIALEVLGTTKESTALVRETRPGKVRGVYKKPLEVVPSVPTETSSTKPNIAPPMVDGRETKIDRNDPWK
nr:protein kinase [Polyangiaceae bacterium]